MQEIDEQFELNELAAIFLWLACMILVIFIMIKLLKKYKRKLPCYKTTNEAQAENAN